MKTKQGFDKSYRWDKAQVWKHHLWKHHTSIFTESLNDLWKKPVIWESVESRPLGKYNKKAGLGEVLALEVDHTCYK